MTSTLDEELVTDHDNPCETRPIYYVKCDDRLPWLQNGTFVIAVDWRAIEHIINIRYKCTRVEQVGKWHGMICYRVMEGIS